MPNFKNVSNEVFWLDVADVEVWKKPEWVEITEAEAQAMQPKPSASQLRRAEIAQRLAQIDTASVRPARAIALEIAQGGAPDAGDLERLATLEAEADALRAELAGLQA